MEQKICQSCAMPIDESTFGTEADGSKNQEYLSLIHISEPTRPY